jgi:molybdopterin-guanine dinucleotide biosynthesis protein A
VILGCVLAGGQSTRFGSDKALATLGGESLLARSVASLAQWCDAVVVSGRSEAPGHCLPDWPRAGMGPLGGLAAALLHAQRSGFDHVLSISVDAVDLPADLPALLSPSPAYLADQPVIGLWPASAAQLLVTLLLSPERHSLRAFAELAEARPVHLAAKPANINTPADLARVQALLKETRDGL